MKYLKVVVDVELHVEVAIVHPFGIHCGGGEKLSLELGRALADAGFRVAFVVDFKEAFKRCSKLLGSQPPCRVVEVRPGMNAITRILRATGRFASLRRLMFINEMYRVASRMKADLTIDTFFNALTRNNIIYVNGPPAVRKAAPWPMHRFYYQVVRLYGRKILGVPKLVLTNSSWTAREIEQHYSMRARVLHPPVDFDFFKYDGRPKERVIVSVARFSPEKNLHLLVRAASKLQDYTWLLMGSRSTNELGKKALEKVKAEVERLKAMNVQFLVNVPRTELRERLLSATFYVHPPFAEPFGIAVAEAMAAGCIPIIYADGGAWEDLVRPLNPSLGYKYVEEIPSIVKSLERKDESYKRGLMDRAV
ncbi:MAG: glycosyltransferase, partial [Candidatus Nezhaarchaeota archaeon]|nr:glycosyltransferase [Candidatus Nezhaarchaeota archaeon]